MLDFVGKVGEVDQGLDSSERSLKAGMPSPPPTSLFLLFSVVPQDWAFLLVVYRESNLMMLPFFRQNLNISHILMISGKYLSMTISNLSRNYGSCA